MQTDRLKKIATGIIFFILIAAATVSLIQGIRNAVSDSQDFQWDCAKAFAMRINPYDVSIEKGGHLSQYDFETYYKQMESNQFPSLLMILLPFTVFPAKEARYVWLVCNILFTALSIYLLRKTFLKDVDIKYFAMLMLLMIAGTPYRNQLGVGQHTIFSFCMVLVAVYFSEYAKRRSFSITCLALFLSYFKYTVTAPLALYFVYKKRYKELAVSIAAHGVLTVFSAFWLHDSIINMIIKPLKVSSWLFTEGGFDLSALLGGGNAAYIVLFVIMLGLLFLSVRMPEGYDNTLITVLTLWSLVITYHRTYDYFIIVIAAGFFTELKGVSHDKPENTEENTYDQPLPRKSSAVTVLEAEYGIVVALVFFVLRLCNENAFSRFLAGIQYYGFTVIVTYVAVMLIMMNNKKKSTEMV